MLLHKGIELLHARKDMITMDLMKVCQQDEGVFAVLPCCWQTWAMQHFSKNSEVQQMLSAHIEDIACPKSPKISKL